MLHKAVGFSILLTTFFANLRSKTKKQRPDLESLVEETFEDPHVVAITPDLGDQILHLTEVYGDEALRQIALFALGMFTYHNAMVEELSAATRFKQHYPPLLMPLV